MKLFFSLFIFLLSNYVYASKIEFPNDPSRSETKLALKKYGLAYCLDKYHRQDTDPTDFGRAMGGYIQRYSIDYDAYQNVQYFIDAKMNSDKNISIIDNQPIFFMGCIDVYESEEYRLELQKQDKYIYVD